MRAEKKKAKKEKDRLVLWKTEQHAYVAVCN